MPSKITEVEVSKEKISIWHPKKGESGFVISLSSGGWLSGIYDSVESAILGAKYDLLMKHEFYEMQKRVNHYDKENRLITVDDFKGLEFFIG